MKKTKQNKTRQNKNKTKQNKTKQNKTKQIKTKQNKTTTTTTTTTTVTTIKASHTLKRQTTVWPVPFGLIRTHQHGIAVGQNPPQQLGTGNIGLFLFLPDGYAMLKRPNNAEKDVQGCHCLSDMAVYLFQENIKFVFQCRLLLHIKSPV